MNLARKAVAPGSEAALAARWAAGIPGPLRLEDGRRLQVIFPGVPGGGPGPDFTGAILDAGGDYLRGAVELHLLASGWRAHGHQTDPAYESVVLHVVGANDTGAPLTSHASGRLIPVFVMPPEQPGFPPPFAPPCTVSVRAGLDPIPALERLGLRRLRIKSARIAPLVAARGPAQALYALLLETLGGPANRAAFAGLASELPLARLLEVVAAAEASRSLAFSAHLKGRLGAVSSARTRPAAAPARRLESAGHLLARLWPANSPPIFPPGVGPGIHPREFQGPGIGRSLAIECLVNAVLPVAIASGEWSEPEAEAAFLALASPGTYGRLRPLEAWLASPTKPFASAARLQGGLLLHADYCTRGMCGRCPLSS
ncbi:MAG: DUF2851 family protein [Dehalococcoidia bacterium]